MTGDFKHFTAFRSAADEVAGGSGQGRWENEGGHVTGLAGHLVQTPGEDKPYKVILEHEDGPCTEHPCSTVREGEAMIRQNRSAREAPVQRGV